MSGKEVIVVFGATGAQGGSVVKALVEDGTFAVRAVTRDPKKESAVKLSQSGVEVVAADYGDEKSLESVLSEASGAFVVTNFWEHCSKDKEIKQGKRIADVAKCLGLKHVIFSGLENVKKLTDGKLEVLHFDENLLTYFKPKKAKDGETYILAIPMGDVPMDGMSVTDIGHVVVSILKSPSEYTGKDIGLSTDKLTVEQYAEKMSSAIGKTIKAAKL